MTKRLEPRDPHWEARCRASFERQPICRTLAVTSVEVSMLDGGVEKDCAIMQQTVFCQSPA